MPDYDGVVIGGGAAGIFGALAAAAARPTLRLLVVERGRRPLAKVRISGGGRCNVTHACFEPAELASYYPRGARELRGPFSRFQPRDTIAWFEARGVRLKTEADGRVFPASDSSSTIIDCLLAECRRLGIALRHDSPVSAVNAAEHGFVVIGQGFDAVTTRTVLMAPGGGSGPAYGLAAALGHTIRPPVPSLFTFRAPDARLTSLAGISVPAVSLTLTPHDEGKAQPLRADGPLLITHWGLSGPAVLRLSAWGARRLADSAYAASLTVNWLPPASPETLFADLRREKSTHPRQRAGRGDPNGVLPLRLWRNLAAAAGIAADATWGELPDRALRRLAEELTRGRFEMIGKGPFKEEFVTCGGVALGEVAFATMESRLRPGLFFAGEILDVDGLTGGFNLQAAWTTGWLAGRGLARRVEEGLNGG